MSFPFGVGARLLLAVALAGSAAAARASSPDLVERIGQPFEGFDRAAGPGCSVGVVRDGELIFSKGFGKASLELQVPNTPQTVFYVGSVSKQFVAASVAIAARQGHLSLDDDIRKHFPEMPGWGTPITVRQMIHHTSGLRDYLELMWMAGMRYEDVHPVEELVSLVARQKALNFVPGDEYSYSNTGYLLLAEIVRRATGQSLRRFAQEHIFGPLGMKNTHFHDDRTEVDPGRALAYERQGAGFRLLWYLNFDQVGSGGLLTTVEDLLLWDQSFYSDTLAGGGLVSQLLEKGVLNDGTALDYAFGLEHGKYRGLPTVSHVGSFMGFRAQLLRFPEERVSIVALCNVSDADPDGRARRVADIVLENRLETVPREDREETKAEEYDDLDLYISGPGGSPFIGVYYSEELDTRYEIRSWGHGLDLRRGRMDPVLLRGVGSREIRYEHLHLVLDEAEEGLRFPGLTVHAGPITGIRFVRVGGADGPGAESR